MVKLPKKISGKEYKFETTEALVKQLKDDSAKASKELESIETTYKKEKKHPGSHNKIIDYRGKKEGIRK